MLFQSIEKTLEYLHNSIFASVSASKVLEANGKYEARVPFEEHTQNFLISLFFISVDKFRVG